MASAKALDAVGLATFKAVVSGLVYFSGFRAISDDDFSRVVIAMRFAESPSLDPSGTSWLPLPFWLMGGAMTLFGSSLEVARAVACAQGIVGTLLLWQAARWLELSRSEALLAAAVASAFPYSAWLGVATVPEYLTAALIVFGVVTANSPNQRRRVLGAFALSLAALCRYEAWFVLAGFALLNAYDAFRSRELRFLGPALLASLAPMAWMLHGRVNHGAASFFLTRVATYRAALGGTLGSTWSDISSYPTSLLLREPELTLLTVVVVLFAWRVGRAKFQGFARPVLLLGAMLAALMAGAVLGGAPTHHPERALLSIWMLAAIALAVGAATLMRSMQPHHYGIARMVAAGCVLLGVLVRYAGPSRQGFVARTAEVELGRQARQLVGSGRVLVGARDYGFFAVMAGFGAPERAIPTDLGDPRSPRAPDCFESPAALEQRVRREHADALIVPREHATLATRLGSVQAEQGSYLLISTREP